MANPSADRPNAPQIQANLHEVAEQLRRAQHLGLAAQGSLADLMEELSRALGPGRVSSDEAAQLAKSAAELAQSLHDDQPRGLLAVAKARLEEAAIRAETKAPLATGLARQLLDALASFGI
jgi:hypothetical protein